MLFYEYRRVVTRCCCCHRSKVVVAPSTGGYCCYSSSNRVLLVALLSSVLAAVAPPTTITTTTRTNSWRGRGTRTRWFLSSFQAMSSDGTSTATTATITDPVRRTKQLQDLWSTSFDAWINVPHHDDPVVYLRPQQQQPSPDDINAILLMTRMSDSCSSSSTCQSTTTTSTTTSPTTTTAAANTCTTVPLPPRRLPAIVHDDNLTMFAMTGYNPMGVDQSMAMNIAANEKLRLDIQKLDQPKPRYVWSAFGFSKEWREDGFVIAYDQVDRMAGEAAMVALAVHYRQGAIFGFDLIRETTAAMANDVDTTTNEDEDKDDATATNTKVTTTTTTTTTNIPIERLLRRTIPAAMANVEAHVVVVPCAKPEGMANADYHHPLSTTVEKVMH